MSTVLATMQAFSNFCCSVAQFSYWFVVFDFNFKATIAEIIGNEEAMDLYRHTTELGSHVRNNSPTVWECEIFLLHNFFQLKKCRRYISNA